VAGARGRDILRMAHQAVPLEKPIGEEEESELGDFVEDAAAASPLTSPRSTCAAGMCNALRERCRGASAE
jgi:DNA-directed RNA polymerase sigma subunit (sigma70/sigma32)